MTPEVSSIVMAIMKKRFDTLMIGDHWIETVNALADELTASLGGIWTIAFFRGSVIGPAAIFLHGPRFWDMAACYKEDNLSIVMNCHSTAKSPLKFAKPMTKEKAMEELQRTTPVGLGDVKIMACKEALAKKKIVGKMKRANSDIVKLVRKIKKATKKKSV